MIITRWHRDYLFYSQMSVFWDILCGNGARRGKFIGFQLAPPSVLRLYNMSTSAQLMILFLLLLKYEWLIFPHPFPFPIHLLFFPWLCVLFLNEWTAQRWLIKEVWLKTKNNIYSYLGLHLLVMGAKRQNSHQINSQQTWKSLIDTSKVLLLILNSPSLFSFSICQETKDSGSRRGVLSGLWSRDWEARC